MNKKGVSLVIVMVAVSIMLILITAASVIGSSVISTANFDHYTSLITRMTDNVNQYYIENGSLPVTSEIISTESLSADFQACLTQNGDIDHQLYVINMDKIKDSTVDTGKGTVANKDVFVVADQTHNVYYMKGYQYKGKVYYGLQPSDYSNEIEYPTVDYLAFTNNQLKIRVSRGISEVKYVEGYQSLDYTKTNGTILTNGMIPIADPTQVYSVYLKNLNNEENISHVSLPFTKVFKNTSTGASGSYQTFTIPVSSKYKIEAYGAAGSKGNRLTQGGKGAYVYGNIELEQGQQLILLVGQMGTLSIPSNTSMDGTAGGSGGASFVTLVENRETSYYLTAYTPNCYVSPLLVAAGGNGGNDGGYTTPRNGQDGSATMDDRATGDGFNRFLTNPNGTTLTKISQTAIGGFGGGNTEDDLNSVGGGWSLGLNTSNMPSSSCNYLRENLGGQSGANAGQGKIIITKMTIDEID